MGGKADGQQSSDPCSCPAPTSPVTLELLAGRRALWAWISPNWAGRGQTPGPPPPRGGGGRGATALVVSGAAGASAGWLPWRCGRRHCMPTATTMHAATPPAGLQGSPATAPAGRASICARSAAQANHRSASRSPPPHLDVVRLIQEAAGAVGVQLQGSGAAGAGRGEPGEGVGGRARAVRQPPRRRRSEGLAGGPTWP